VSGEVEIPVRDEAVAALHPRLSVLVFLLAFAASCLGLSAAVERLPGVQLIEGSVERAKFRGFARHADQFDLAFVGTSRVMRQVVPTLFDRRMGQLGTSLRSYNFGLGGMKFAEIGHTVEWILARRPARLKWLVIELRELDKRSADKNEFTRRMVFWHSPKATLDLCRIVAASEEPLGERLSEIAMHLHHLGYRLGNVGTALPIFRDLMGRAQEETQLDVQPDGYVPYRREHGPRFEEDLAFLEEARREYLATPGSVEAPPLYAETMEAMARELRAAGIEPIFLLVPPISEWRSEFFRYARVQAPPPVLAYHDPVEYPLFWRGENLYNRYHLNGKGARELSKLLAEDVARIMGQQ
jgi:hypothetical protein